MTLQVDDYVNAASTALLDATQRLWEPAEVLGFYNEARRIMGLAKPNAFSSPSKPTRLRAGVLQYLTPDEMLLIRDRVLNIGTDGVTPGEAPVFVARKDQDYARPGWANDPPSNVVRCIMYDKNTPTFYYVWPASTGMNYLQYERLFMPAQVLGQTADFPDIYQGVVDHLMLGLAYRKNSKRGDMAKFQSYFATGMSLLGVRKQAEPEQQAGGGDGNDE